MKAYKGLIQIECKRKKGGCLRNLHKDVEPGCMDCPEAESSVVGLDGKSIFKYRSPDEKTGQRTRKKKKED